MMKWRKCYRAHCSILYRCQQYNTSFFGEKHWLAYTGNGSSSSRISKEHMLFSASGFWIAVTMGGICFTETSNNQHSQLVYESMMRLVFFKKKCSLDACNRFSQQWRNHPRDVPVVVWLHLYHIMEPARFLFGIVSSSYPDPGVVCSDSRDVSHVHNLVLSFWSLLRPTSASEPFSTALRDGLQCVSNQHIHCTWSKRRIL